MIRTWDAATQLPMVSFGDRIFKFMGAASVGWDYTGGAQSGTIVDGRFTQYPGCVGSAFVISSLFDNSGGGVILSISGNTLTWRYPYPEAVFNKRSNATFVYGIY